MGDEVTDEPMDYTPIPAEDIAIAPMPDEAWDPDGSGPMGF
jgi:hypothetical protein